MATYITAIRLNPPSSTQHEHITHVRWEQPGNSSSCDRQAMVDFINQENTVYVHGRPDAQVGVVKANPPYLRTHADGNWNNNLLELPRF